MTIQDIVNSRAFATVEQIAVNATAGAATAAFLGANPVAGAALIVTMRAAKPVFNLLIERTFLLTGVKELRENKSTWRNIIQLTYALRGLASCAASVKIASMMNKKGLALFSNTNIPCPPFAQVISFLAISSSVANGFHSILGAVSNRTFSQESYI